MASQNEIDYEFATKVNFSSYRLHKPIIMDLNVLRIPVREEGVANLEHFLRLKDKIQNSYEKAIKSAQKFVIPRLQLFKIKYTPKCCTTSNSNADPLYVAHNHFEYKIIKLLESLQSYLDDTIKVPRRILEIKLLEND